MNSIDKINLVFHQVNYTSIVVLFGSATLHYGIWICRFILPPVGDSEDIHNKTWNGWFLFSKFPFSIDSLQPWLLFTAISCFMYQGNNITDTLASYYQCCVDRSVPACGCLSLLATREPPGRSCSRVRVSQTIEKVFPGEISHGPPLPDWILTLASCRASNFTGRLGVLSSNIDGAKPSETSVARMFEWNLALFFFLCQTISPVNVFCYTVGRLE